MVVHRERRPLTDQEVDEIIGTLLRWGVVLAASVVAFGGIWYLIKYGASIPDYRVFRGEPRSLRSLHGIVSPHAGLPCRRLIQFGVLLLIAVPVARVAFSVFAFFLQRDHAYVVITLIVLGVLMYSLLGHP